MTYTSTLHKFNYCLKLRDDLSEILKVIVIIRIRFLILLIQTVQYANNTKYEWMIASHYRY